MTATAPDTPRAFLVGAGIASLSAAVFLIRDAGLDGSSIRILEELDSPGGALDGSSHGPGATSPEAPVCSKKRRTSPCGTC